VSSHAAGPSAGLKEVRSYKIASINDRAQKKRSVERRSVFSGKDQPNQVQVMTPLVMSQVFADCV
jgi:hypothetical protein